MAENAMETAAPVDATLPLLSSKNIQGNILAPFNKPYQRFLFISFMSRRAEARAWLEELVGAGVASTSEVVTHNKAYAQAKENGETLPRRQWVGVSFTSSGLMTLDPGLARDLLAYDAFWQGPLVDREYRGERRTSPAVVGNIRRGDPTQWVVGGPGQYPVDAVVTVAADDERGLQKRAGDARASAVGRGLAVLSWQDCRRRPTDEGTPGVEPFGFRDGISQPGVRGFTASADHNGRREAADQAGSPIIATGEFVLGYDAEGGSYPDAGRAVPAGWMRDGAFQVLLRLRQDVDGWEAQMRDLSASSGDTVDAAATAIGRTTDGKPLVALGRGGGLNDFDFTDDQLGEQTRRFAHIRKMNPRNGTYDDRVHRLLRRGIPFATPLQVETRLPGAENVAENAAGQPEDGLVFNAFIASIENQFEYVLRNWASNPDSLPPVAADGPDPVVGASDAPCVFRRGKADPGVEIHFGRFVWTSGAVYAFAPSLSQLARLARPDRVEVEGEVTGEVG